MDIKDLLENNKNLTSEQLDRRLDELVRTNYRYQNLSEGNKKLILDLIKKYKQRIRSGEHISDSMVDRDMYGLYGHRTSLKLTENDLADIRDILESFQS